MKKIGIVVLSLTTILFGGSARAWASETDILLRKLVQKGVLTEQEAKEVKEEVVQEAAKERAQQNQPVALSLPKGDTVRGSTGSPRTASLSYASNGTPIYPPTA